MVDLNGKLGLHVDFRYQLVHVGAERAPVLVIDNLLEDFQVLIDYAAEHSAFEGVSDAFYPGLRAVLPPIYSFALRAFLTRIVCEAFGLGNSEVIGGNCGFALVTTMPEKLKTVQRMPHFDNTNLKQFALLHYLCPVEMGGTSFYRHRQTGYEVIDRQRLPHYTNVIKSELDAHGPPPARYIAGDDSMFERIESFEGGFNRMLIYRSAHLHSANIRTGFGFDANPRTGRLTANAFFIFR